MIKVWSLFFDSEGHNRCGTEWAHPFDGHGESYVTQKILFDKSYCKPKEAVGFMVLSDYDFMHMTYEEIEQRYKKYGRSVTPKKVLER